MSRWIILLSIALGVQSTAVSRVPSPQLTVDSGTEISIESYDAKTDTFLLAIVEEQGVGPNYATPEMLRRALALPGDQKEFMRQKNQMIGSIYQLKAALPLVTEDDMERRRRKAGAGVGR